MTVAWVFGYGSLVSPASLGRTLGRPVARGTEVVTAELAGYGRRWNYGIGHVAGWWTDAAGRDRACTIVALGLVRSDGEDVNGIVVGVDAAELARLDRRERQYDRVDVTGRVRSELPAGAPVVTYVPRPEAIAAYTTARERGEAAIEQRYWDLVDGAFGALGPAQHRRYHATTPTPDVPVRVVRRT